MTPRGRRLLDIGVTATLVLALAAFITRTEIDARRDADTQIQQHARVVSGALWSLDRDGPRDYLNLAIQNGNYQALTITTSDGEQFFSAIGSPLRTPADRILAAVGLIPLLHLRANIAHEGRLIGFIEVSVRLKSIYIDFYAFLIALLLFEAYRLYQRLLAANRDLDDKVRRRTATLRESEARLRSFFDLPLIGFSIIEPGKPGIVANERLAQMFGYSRSELLQISWNDITHPDDMDVSTREYERLMAGEISNYAIEKRYVRKDGSILWVAIAVSALRGENGAVKQICGYFEDISERKAAEQALRISEDRYRTAFQTSLDFILLTRLKDTLIIDANQTFVHVTGYQLKEVVGKTAHEIGLWYDWEERKRLIAALREKGALRDIQTRLRRKNGEDFWGLLSSSIIDIAGEPHILTMVRDITEAKAAEAEIKNLAFYDPLTGLANRRLLTENIRRSLAFIGRTRGHAALLIIDIDRFKDLNDAYGHPTGDLVLKEVARSLSSCVREVDTISRVASDEFVILYEDLGSSAEEAASQAKKLAEKILYLFQDPILLEGHDLSVTLGIGITVFSHYAENPAEIFREADIAMHQAKAIGRNSLHFFSPELQVSATSRSLLEKELRQALRANEFVLYYQPQIERGAIVGAEALMRWIHPTRGILLPDNFIPPAERAGLITAIGEWTLDTACRQIVVWSRSPLTASIQLAVNISALQFRKANFEETVLAALERSGANPANLKLEITESTMVESIEDAIAKMTALRARGLSFSLDDFGTGYSSLSYLQRLPLDQLKIDRSFVRDILVDSSSVAIAQTIISLGQALRLPVVAEGVETNSQRELLEKIGCHCFQGYLYSRPVPIEQFDILIRRFTPHTNSRPH